MMRLQSRPASDIDAENREQLMPKMGKPRRLTEEQALELQRWYAARRMSMKQKAQQFGVSPATIRRYCVPSLREPEKQFEDEPAGAVIASFLHGSRR